ncbi:UDP-3-O-acyl-N-acetylglucosamine deacetylase [Alphaproteobacteria bacterium]|nr:UDP-3-O-acyl-N-acetylglucosamine deacetylase [Alphaproteobacteria bacterium]
MLSSFQKTINSKISCSSIALHSGQKTTLTLHPAIENTGIVFVRSDQKNVDNKINANFRNVTTTNLGTTISNSSSVKISTIEHLMASIWGCGIDNLIIEVDGPEIPIMDGSSEPFVFMIECAGIKTSDQIRKVISITKKFCFTQEDKFIEVSPSSTFELDIRIDFDNSNITNNQYEFHASNNSFKNDICRARTFCFEDEIKAMHTNGLAKGGSLNNAIVIGKDGIINETGLRYKDEFVKHKTLDFLGDMYLAQHFIIGKFKAFKTGHNINNKFLHQLFANEDCWNLS